MNTIVKCIKSAVAHTDAVTCLLAKDFTVVSGGHDGSIRFWDIRKMQLLYELPVFILFVNIYSHTVRSTMKQWNVLLIINQWVY